MNLESKLDIYLKSPSVKPVNYVKKHPPRLGYLRNTPYGEVWIVDWTFEAGYLHGRFEVEKLSRINSLIDFNLMGFNPARATVIDIETTGLAGGTGTYAFIIGAGFWKGRRFVIRQYLMRDFNEESAQLYAFTEDFSGNMISYNGRCFDVPLLINRFRLHRFDNPFENASHLDMLFSCRRIWKRHLSSFKLTDIEMSVLGYARQDDIPSYLIPSIFFDFLQNRDETTLFPILNHNRDDILSLYQLTTMTSALVGQNIRCGSNDDELLLSLAEICFNARQYRKAIALTQKINQDFASQETLGKTAKLKAMAYKRLGMWNKAVGAFTDVHRFNPEIHSLIELAKLYEHKSKDIRKALEIVTKAETLLELEEIDGADHTSILSTLAYRKLRLERKLSRLFQY